MKQRKKTELFPTTASFIILIVFLLICLILVCFSCTERRVNDQTIYTALESSNIKNLQLNIYIPESSLSWMTDFYSVFWGMVVAVIIFIFEISKEYQYGLTLKRIVNLSIGTFTSTLCGLFFLLSCPAAYLCENNNKSKTLQAILIVSFIFFLCMLMFLIYFSKQSSVRKLIEYSTERQVITMQKHLQSDSPAEKVPKFNDSLLIHEMIEHIDYTSIQEWSNMTDAISRCIAKPEVQNCLSGTLAEHTIVKSIANHIIYKSGCSSEYVRMKTTDILDSLLEKLINKTENNLLSYETTPSKELWKKRKIISYILQIMLPFFDHNSEDSIKTFLHLWSRYQKYHFEVLPYIFVYLKYRAIFINSLEPVVKKILLQNETWNICLQQFNGFCIDNTLVLTLWFDWEQYSGNGEIRCLYELRHFIKKLELLSGYELMTML